jgi:mono/diheme cytochrome c family protein
MSEEARKDENEIRSLNEEIDIDQVDPDELEDVSGGSCSGCHGIYKPSLDGS